MNPLAQRALIGTAQQSSGTTTVAPPIDTLLDRLERAEAERDLLMRAGAWATYERAGHVAQTTLALPDPAPDEHLAVCNPRVTQLIELMLNGRHGGVLEEALQRLHAARLRLPPVLLPLALGMRSPTLRAVLHPVLGERGRWLGQFNADWHWATQPVLTGTQTIPEASAGVWQEGSPSQRIAVLRFVREIDPAQGRTWVEEVWQQEKADFRREMMDALAVGLSEQDEAFLEQALDDRSSAVKTQAAELLARIPTSALVGRMRERAAEYLSYTPPAKPQGLLSRVRATLSGDQAGTLQVTLPEGLDKTIQRDGIVAKPPTSTGEHAWWLEQIIALVPPTFWEERWNADAATLIAAAEKHEWATAVITGWSRAAILHRSATWMLPLWRWWERAARSNRTGKSGGWVMLEQFLPAMPPAELKQIVREIILDLDRFGTNRPQILGQLPKTWDTDTGMAFLDTLHTKLRRILPEKMPSTEYWPIILPNAALALPPACFARALALPELPDHDQWHWREWRRQVDSFIETIQLRQQLIQEIPL